MNEELLKIWMPVTKNADGSLSGILSDTSLDRDGEFMTKELLEDWAKNTSLKALANHENKMEKWVGGWSDIKIINKGDHHALIAKPWFFSKEANPLAHQIKMQVEEALAKGENAGISIGAIPLESIKKEIEGKERKGYSKAELLEATWVPIQSNRNATFGAVAKSFDILKDFSESEITKSKDVETCVRGLMSDSEFKPQEGKTKEESAWAVCQSKKEMKTCGVCDMQVDSDKMKEHEKEKHEDKKMAEIEVQKEVEKVEIKNEELEVLKLENQKLQKELADLKNYAVLKATVEGPLVKENGIKEPTIENALKAKFGFKN